MTNKCKSNVQIITLLEICRRSVIICQLIVNLLVIVQSNKICTVKVKVKQSRYRPGVAQRVPRN
jgi:hypothetical protein